MSIALGRFNYKFDHDHIIVSQSVSGSREVAVSVRSVLKLSVKLYVAPNIYKIRRHSHGPLALHFEDVLAFLFPTHKLVLTVRLLAGNPELSTVRTHSW